MVGSPPTPGGRELRTAVVTGAGLPAGSRPCGSSAPSPSADAVRAPRRQVAARARFLEALPLRSLIFAGACAAALVLDATPVLAQTVLVSNVSDSAQNLVNFASISNRAQSFTTGNNATGPTLSSVDIVSSDNEGDSFAVSVCAVDTNGYPTTSCTAPTGMNAFAAGTITFTHAPGVPLVASTDYTVLVEPSTSMSFSYREDGREDLGTPGWRIDNRYDFFDTVADAWKRTGGTRALRIGISGFLGQNNVTTGSPSISDMARVGSTLTASTARIGNADGLGSFAGWSARLLGER